MMVLGIDQARLIPSSQTHHNQCGEQCCKGEPGYGILAERQDDDSSQQGAEGGTSVASDLEYRLCQAFLSSRCQLRYA